MNHEAHIRLIDAHAESVGRNHDRLAVIEEIILIVPALRIAQTGMVARRSIPVCAKQAAHFLHVFPRRAIDNAAAIPHLRQKIEQLTVLLVRRAHLKAKIGPIKARRHAEWILKIQQFDDVGLHLFGRCRGKRAHDGALGQRLDERPDAQIARTKILPPLGDAVRLVHRQQRNLGFPAKLPELIGFQSFRSNVDDFIHPAARIFNGVRILPRRQRGIEISRAHSGLVQRCHLILHQRDQRRNDQRNAGQQQCGNLKAD